MRQECGLMVLVMVVVMVMMIVRMSDDGDGGVLQKPLTLPKES